MPKGVSFALLNSSITVHPVLRRRPDDGVTKRGADHPVPVIHTVRGLGALPVRASVSRQRLTTYPTVMGRSCPQRFTD